MDNFELLIKTLLENDNYWVKQSYKVELTKNQKLLAGSPSMPRPELDLVAFNHKRNHLLLIEVKSFLDSKGVDGRDIIDISRSSANRYKLFTRPEYRKVVIEEAQSQLIANGLIDSSTSVQLALVAGNVVESEMNHLRHHFKKNNWLLIEPSDIKSKLIKLKDSKYNNDLMSLTVKMLLN